MNTENPEKDAFLSDSPGRQTDFQAGMNLTGVGRDIDEQGGIRIEITSDRTRDDIAGNRPGSQLRENPEPARFAGCVYVYRPAWQGDLCRQGETIETPRVELFQPSA